MKVPTKILTMIIPIRCLNPKLRDGAKENVASVKHVICIYTCIQQFNAKNIQK